VAVGIHANDAVAQSFTGNHPFFHYAYALMTKWLWPFMFLVTIPSVVMWQTARRKRRL
jgi:uncharacterized membrane protein